MGDSIGLEKYYIVQVKVKREAYTDEDIRDCPEAFEWHDKLIPTGKVTKFETVMDALNSLGITSLERVREKLSLRLLDRRIVQVKVTKEIVF